uniref:Uncharacterized protein n=1 Tax=Anguilla anguilla TaxID=7936 RepID=A0A0E9PMN9_ANGAN
MMTSHVLVHAKALLLVTEKSENGTSGCWPITNALRPL